MTDKAKQAALVINGAPTEAIERAVQRGFESWVWAVEPEQMQKAVSDPAMVAQQLQQVCPGEDVALAALLCATVSLFDLAKNDPDEAAIDVRSMINLAGCCGDDLPVILPADTAGGAPPDVITDYEGMFNRLFAELVGLTAYAEPRTVSLLLENPARGLLMSPLELRGLIDEINSGWIGIAFNPGNVPPDGDAADWIHILGQRIGAVILPTPDSSDYAGGKNHSAMAALQETRFSGPVLYR